MSSTGRLHGHKHHHHPKTAPLPSFEQLDINHDGKLTGTELQKVKGYDTGDKTGAGKGDGTITKDEFLAGRHTDAHAKHEQYLDKAFAKADGNHDGKLSGTELGKLKQYAGADGTLDRAGFEKAKGEDYKKKVDANFDDAFKKLDGNHDGVLTGTEAKGFKNTDGKDGISADEFKAQKKEQNKADREKKLLEGDPKDQTAPTGGGAGKPADNKDQGFKASDKNKDGVLSGDELGKFKNADANHDGQVTRDEALAQAKKDQQDKVQAKRDKQFDKLDGNKDGSLTGTEAKKYEKYDANHDGKIDKTEFEKGSAEAAQAKHAAGFKKESDKAWGEADGNKDGSLTGTEAKKYEKYDANHDGKIDRQEFDKALQDKDKAKWEKHLLGNDQKPKKDKQAPAHQGHAAKHQPQPAQAPHHGHHGHAAKHDQPAPPPHSVGGGRFVAE